MNTKGMKILVVGSGGREHAIAWKLAGSPLVETVFVAPGNGGTALEERCVNVLADVDIENRSGHLILADFAEKAGVAFTVVGPEVPLAAGIASVFHEKGLAVVGPDKHAARLEASKAYAKSFMAKYGVRTAQSHEFSGAAGFEQALVYARDFFEKNKAPLVIKADGLAAGKGVVIAGSFAEASPCLRAFMKDGVMGGAGNVVVLEEFLEGKEVSVLAAVSVKDGRGSIVPFVSARDHKRRFDEDKGPNTGGMGAVAPVPDFDGSAAEADFHTAILEPTLKGLCAENFDYRGFIFFGLMVKDDRCRLLEYNVRLGDPETQAVLPLLETDFAELCLSILDGSLSKDSLAWKRGAICAPVAVADGYPAAYRKGDLITTSDINTINDVKLFAAGASLKDSGLYTSGGRVLAVSAFGEDAAVAHDAAYRALSLVRFEGMGFRTDIF